MESELGLKLEKAAQEDDQKTLKNITYVYTISPRRGGEMRVDLPIYSFLFDRLPKLRMKNPSTAKEVLLF